MLAANNNANEKGVLNKKSNREFDSQFYDPILLVPSFLLLLLLSSNTVCLKLIEE